MGRAQDNGEQFQVIKAKLNLKLLTLPQGTVFAFSPPAIAESALRWIPVRTGRPRGKGFRIPGEQPEQVSRSRPQTA